MVDPRSLRANPRSSSKAAAPTHAPLGVARKRARSVPTDSAGQSDKMLTTLLSLKRKRSVRKAAEDDAMMSAPPSTQLAAGPREALSLTMPGAAEESGPSGRGALADSAVQEVGLLTPAPSQSKFTSKDQFLPQDGSPVSRKDKGKQKAPEGQVDGAPSEHSTPEPTAKRRRTDRPANSYTGHTVDFPLDTVWSHFLFDAEAQKEAERDAHQVRDADLETNFQLLDIADIAALPSVPVDLASAHAENMNSGSMYVPPVVAQLINAMNHALALERSARQRAEERYVCELGRRVKAECAANALAQKNAVLEVETCAWARAASRVLAEQFTALPQPGPSGLGGTLAESGNSTSTSTNAPPTSWLPSEPAIELVMPVDPQPLGGSPDVPYSAAVMQQFFQQLALMSLSTDQPSPS